MGTATNLATTRVPIKPTLSPPTSTRTISARAAPTGPDVSEFLYRQLTTMVSRIAFWSLFGVGVRFWQMGIEMRPFFQRSNLWVYPIYATGGASFGYWLQGVDDKQTALLTERKNRLLEKRAKRAQEAQSAEAEA